MRARHARLAAVICNRCVPFRRGSRFVEIATPYEIILEELPSPAIEASRHASQLILSGIIQWSCSFSRDALTHPLLDTVKFRPNTIWWQRSVENPRRSLMNLRSLSILCQLLWMLRCIILVENIRENHESSRYRKFVYLAAHVNRHYAVRFKSSNAFNEPYQNSQDLQDFQDYQDLTRFPKVPKTVNIFEARSCKIIETFKSFKSSKIIQTSPGQFRELLNSI